MSRSFGSRSKRRRSSTDTAEAVRDRVEILSRAASTAVPDERRSLSDAIVIEASIAGRVLGLRLLRLEASVVVTPANIETTDRSLRPPAGPTSPRSNGARPQGEGLVDATRVLDESAAMLGSTRTRQR
jgi:hypothetical protein